MPEEQRAARRAERPYSRYGELPHKLDLDELLELTLYRVGRQAFLRELARGSYWGMTWHVPRGQSGFTLSVSTYPAAAESILGSPDARARVSSA